MNILSIETSCDETAISIVRASGGFSGPSFDILGNSLMSQIDIHKQYGGVFPMMAKREHAKNLPHILKDALTQANMYTIAEIEYMEETWEEVSNILDRETGLYDSLKAVCEHLEKPPVDMIAVTSGPGLAPALWVGISCAKALGKLWNIPVIGVNHMEGHIVSVLIGNKEKREVEFPALALLISGGHTELVDIQSWGKYTVIGSTRDDAVGEAFDKVARMLSLPYPGGPEISRLAEEADLEHIPNSISLPRPMIHSNDFDFSFSGLKTSVLYYVRDNGPLSLDQKKDMARAFEDAVVDVLVTKTKKALSETGAETLIIAGGVIANKKIRNAFNSLSNEFSGITVYTPTQILSTDNALMIACAGYLQTIINPDILNTTQHIIAEGNMKLSK